MAENTPLAVYVHWPYCTRICPYCDFNVYKEKAKNFDLVDAIVADLQGWKAWSGPRSINSIHFGGGTPSLLSAKEISKIIDEVNTLWGISDHTEIALEANPIDSDEQKWSGYKAAGVNRLSLGVQTFNEQALKTLGRDHNSQQALSALDLASSTFTSVSADLIFGWSEQTKKDLETDLKKLTNTGAQHISTYQLTIEPGTAFAKAESRGLSRAVDADKSADFFEQIMGVLSRQGFEHYEVSNFALPGHKSQHNLAYWRGYDYVGVGPGAHGRLISDGTKHATIAALTPLNYNSTVLKTGIGISDKDSLTASEWSDEFVLMGLRTDEGISLSRYAQIRGEKMDDARMTPLIENGLLRLKEDRLIATQKGRFLLNAVTEALLV